MIILLIGLLGSGKSSVGKQLAENLNYPFVEMDEVVLKHSGFSSIEEIYDQGISLWKEFEQEVSKELSFSDNLVIACGGGIVENNINLLYFKEHCKDLHIVFLKTKSETILKRSNNQNKGKKLTARAVHHLLSKREKLYLEEANMVINTDTKNISAITHEIMLKIFENESPDHLHLYQKLLLLCIDKKEQNFYVDVQGTLNNWLLVAILIELVLQKKIKIISNGIEILDPWYVPTDEIIRLVFHHITTPPNPNRLGTELQNLYIIDRKTIFRRIINDMVEKNLLKVEQHKIFMLQSLFFYEPASPVITDIIIKDVLDNISKKEISTKDIYLFVLLDKLNMANKIFGEESVVLFRQKIDHLIRHDPTFVQLELLKKETVWALSYFSYKP